MPETRLWGRGERAWRRSGRRRRREGPDSSDRDAGDPPEPPCAPRHRQRRRGGRTCLLSARDTRDRRPCAPWGWTSPRAGARPRGNLLRLFLRNGSFPVREGKLFPKSQGGGLHTHAEKRRLKKIIIIHGVGAL